MSRASGPKVASLVALLALAAALGGTIGTVPDVRGPATAADADADADAETTPPGTVIDGCTTINESGRYVLDGDLPRTGTMTSSACIDIVASDVVLDGRGYTFTGRGVSNTTGIYAAGVSNVTVRNVSVGDWHRAIHLRGVTNGTVRNVEVESSVYGITLAESEGVVVAGSRVTGNFVGVVENGGDSQFRNNSVEGNDVDFDRKE